MRLNFDFDKATMEAWERSVESLENQITDALSQFADEDGKITPQDTITAISPLMLQTSVKISKELLKQYHEALMEYLDNK